MRQADSLTPLGEARGRANGPPAPGRSPEASARREPGELSGQGRELGISSLYAQHLFLFPQGESGSHHTPREGSEPSGWQLTPRPAPDPSETKRPHRATSAARLRVRTMSSSPRQAAGQVARRTGRTWSKPAGRGGRAEGGISVPNTRSGLGCMAAPGKDPRWLLCA